MYKEIIKWVIAIISQPGKAWDMLSRKEEKGDEFLSRFIYPLIGLVTVAAFLGVLFTRKEFDVELALKSSIKTLVASFGGFLPAHLYTLYILYCMGRGRPLHAGGRERTPEVCRYNDRYHFADTGGDRVCFIHADAGVTLLTVRKR